MALLEQQYVDDLERARLTGLASGSDCYITSLVPAASMNAAGWTNFSFDHTDFARYKDTSYKMKRAKTSAGGGVLGFGGGREKTE